MYIPPSKMDTPTKKAIVDDIFIRKKLNFISSENANPSRIQENVLIKMFFILLQVYIFDLQFLLLCLRRVWVGRL